jgi:hypothetical protein
MRLGAVESAEASSMLFDNEVEISAGQENTIDTIAGNQRARNLAQQIQIFGRGKALLGKFEIDAMDVGDLGRGA